MKKGQAYLALIFLIGGTVALIAVTLTFLTGTFVDTGYGYRASVQAEAVAGAGAEDALLRLNRDASFTSTGYSLAVGSSTATVVVSSTTPTAGYPTILSTATVNSRVKKINVVVSIGSNTGQISVVSWQSIQ